MEFTAKRKYYQIRFGIGVALLAVLIVVALNCGVARISVGQSLRIIASRIPGLNHWIPVYDIDRSAVTILLNLRLPRILLALVAGAGLAVAGAAFQGIFKNPMAEPYVLGISSGTALGAALAMAMGLEANLMGFGLITFSAFVAGLITAMTVYRIARIGRKTPTVTLLLSGIAVNFFLTASISLIMTFKREQIERIVMWTMGSVAAANWTEVLMVSPLVLLATGVLSIYSRDLNLVLLGDETAQSLGVEVEKVKRAILGVSTLLVAAIVSVSGIIGFVGLIVPHMVRILCGPDHRAVIPFSALGGAALLIGCDTLARTLVPPSEIPVGIITSLFGVPFFLYLLVKGKKKVFYE
jgi:iron complex transport system permease protein